MDRASACGAEDPGSIPGERTTSRILLLATLLAAAPAHAQRTSSDEALTYAPTPGWTMAPPAPGRVLTARHGEGSLDVSAAPDDRPLEELARAQAARYSAQGLTSGPAERRTSAGGLPYLVVEARGDGASVLYGAIAVDRIRYLWTGERVTRRAALALLDSLARYQPEPPPQPQPPLPEDAEPPPAGAAFFGGSVLLPAPPGARLAAQPDGWTVAVGERWNLGLHEGASADAYLAVRGRELEAKRGCRAGKGLERPLANGWDARFQGFSCPDAPPGVVTLLGAAVRPSGAPLELAGSYQDAADFDFMLAWLGQGADTRSPSPRSPLKPPLSRRAALLGLVLGTAGLAALAWRARASAPGTARTPR